MPSEELNFAAIDIGSNAVRLLIKSVRAGDPPSRMTKKLMLRLPVRLGEDAFRRGKISRENRKRLIQAVKAFRLLLGIYEVTDYRACATSAMRDASNGRKIAGKIREKTGIDIEVIGGVEEARIVYDSHIGDLLDKTGDYIYVDVGGGSTEISLICDGALQSSRSYDIGTVRSLSGKVKRSDRERLAEDLEELTRLYPGLQIIGSGGNINKLYRLTAKEEPGGNRLPVPKLREIYRSLKDMNLEQRMERFGLNRDRADVIVPAAEIFLEIAERTEAAEIFVPMIGIIDGITHSLYARYLQQEA